MVGHEGAVVRLADLFFAVFDRADLTDARPDGADLRGPLSSPTPEQLSTAVVTNAARSPAELADHLWGKARIVA